MKDQFFNAGFLCRLRHQKLFKSHAIALIQMVANQLEHVVPDFGEQGEWHHVLLVAVIHVTDVRIWCGVMSD